jgi:hypothetical protein
VQRLARGRLRRRWAACLMTRFTALEPCELFQIQFVAAASTHVALVVQTLWAEKIQSTTDAGSLNTFGRNEIEVAVYFIGTSSHCVFSNTIQNLPCSGPRTRSRRGIRTGMRTRPRLLKQNENRRDGAATGPWSYLVVRSCGSGRARPPRSRRARAEDAGCRQRRDDRFRSCPVSRPRACHGLSRRRIGPMPRHSSPCQGLWHCQNKDERGVLNRRCPGGATAGDGRKMSNEPLVREPIECVRARLAALVKANAAPRCGARSKRTGLPCRAAAMPNGRCKVHGGKSTGPRTPEGLARSRRANWKHGYYSREAKAERSRVRAAILAVRYLSDSI